MESFKALLEDLRTRVDELALGSEVLQALLPGGRPHDMETQLWDYKLSLPTISERPSDEDRKRFDAELGSLIKDVVAFHNAYGGYILFGVADRGNNRVRGVGGRFDCGDFNSRLQSYTGVSIECHATVLPADTPQGSQNLLLLLIPRRANGIAPVRFQKEGPRNLKGERSFQKETYVRVRDQCRPATNTSEDWEFLHGPRVPPDRISPVVRVPVRSALPARDLDLVKFVGREAPLAQLRHWLGDDKSPIRLITGIGGLGKTTLATRFAEEVVSTGAGNIEWVIWLTAKRQTYSALRGRMVATGKVDFSDERSLYNSVLKVLSYEMPLEAEDSSLDEVRDRVSEALGIYSCLVIVDDIDSLEPDDQKELVAQLHRLALLTVGRDLPPSRVLLTSRLDQGLPETAVVKLHGLERVPFDQYVANLCANFSINPIRGSILENLFQATSGSPLFAASVVRFVKLGEKPQTVIDTWRGEDGEEVREFAFRREVSRLTTGEARLLYAVLLLGETTVEDLAEILEVTARMVRERISGLQAYHLMATDTRQSGESVVYAPDDLSSISEIVRKHLGGNARSVEEACGRAQQTSNSGSAKIGLTVRRILAAWREDRPVEAVVLAQELRKEFPSNADVESILGASLLRTKPPRFQEADRALEEALRLGCKRPELLPNLFLVKAGIEDWARLQDLSQDLVSNEFSRDPPLDAYLLATSKLIEGARLRGSEHRVAELSIAAVEKIAARIARARVHAALFKVLTDQMSVFARVYIASLQRISPRPGDKLRIFEGVARLSQADVVLSDLVGIGIAALKDWWADVEHRPMIDGEASDILLRQLRRLEKISRQYASFGSKTSGTQERIREAMHDLEYRGGKLAENIGR